MADNKEYMHAETNLHISEDVVTSIVIGAAKEIDGVFAVAPAANMTNYVKKGGNRAVKVAVNDGALVIDMNLTVNYGVSIPETAEKVQTAVAAAVEAMTGYCVKEVNIVVAGIHLD